jgi:hypothetical protein
MKKYLPLFLFLIGVIVIVAVFYFITRSTKESSAPEDTETAPEVVLNDRPIASLTPTADGHWLTLKIEKFKVAAETLDYELLYTLPDGRTQGVPGSVSIKGEETVERKLLLGSESSGKFRYDEGVEEGTLTLKFRNSAGKLVAKFSTKFHLQSNTKDISSVDGEAKLTLKKIPTKTFFVTMSTFGVSIETPAELTGGPWGIFTSSTVPLSGTVSLGSAKTYRFTGSKWQELTGGVTSDLGIFIGTN